MSSCLELVSEQFPLLRERVACLFCDFPEIDKRGQELLRRHDHPRLDRSW
jgi:hypothetical protein